MWPKYFSISPFNEYSGLISFRIDWFDLLAVQETLKSFLQHHSSKASILLHLMTLIPRVHPAGIQTKSSGVYQGPSHSLRLQILSLSSKDG